MRFLLTPFIHTLLYIYIYNAVHVYFIERSDVYTYTRRTNAKAHNAPKTGSHALCDRFAADCRTRGVEYYSLGNTHVEYILSAATESSVSAYRVVFMLSSGKHAIYVYARIHASKSFRAEGPVDTSSLYNGRGDHIVYVYIYMCRRISYFFEIRVVRSCFFVFVSTGRLLYAPFINHVRNRVYNCVRLRMKSAFYEQKKKKNNKTLHVCYNIIYIYYIMTTGLNNNSGNNNTCGHVGSTIHNS